MTSPILTDLLTLGVPLLDKLIRTLAVYFFLIFLLRTAGKRTLGSFNSFDLVVLLLLSNTVQNAIIGNDNSLIGGLVGAVVLVIVNYVVVWFLFKHRKVEHTIEGSPTILMRHGHYLDQNLKHQLISRDELQAAARRQGIQRMSDICIARLEVGGTVTFELTTPTEGERNTADIVARLDRIETALIQLSTVRHASVNTPETPPSN